MNKCLSTALLCLSFTSFAAELQRFDEVKKIASVGQAIHIVTDFSQCNMTSINSSAPTRLGVFTPEQLQVVDTYIASSFMHFTLNNPKFPNTPVFEFVRYTLKDDNSLDLSYQTLNATTYAPLSDKVSMNCKMGAGIKNKP